MKLVHVTSLNQLLVNNISLKGTTLDSEPSGFDNKDLVSYVLKLSNLNIPPDYICSLTYILLDVAILIYIWYSSNAMSHQLTIYSLVSSTLPQSVLYMHHQQFSGIKSLWVHQKPQNLQKFQATYRVNFSLTKLLSFMVQRRFSDFISQ